MNEIIQHVPPFVCSGDDEARPRAYFSTMAELLSVPWVARWSAMSDFVRFSKDDEYLMAELSTPPIGQFLVVGRVIDMASVDLPQWLETEEHRVRREAWNRGEAQP